MCNIITTEYVKESAGISPDSTVNTKTSFTVTSDLWTFTVRLSQTGETEPTDFSVFISSDETREALLSFNNIYYIVNNIHSVS